MRLSWHSVQDLDINSEEFINIMNEMELSTEELEIICGVSSRHFRNILNGDTVTVRFRTKKKIQNGLETRGVGRDQSDKLFISY